MHVAEPQGPRALCDHRCDPCWRLCWPRAPPLVRSEKKPLTLGPCTVPRGSTCSPRPPWPRPWARGSRGAAGSPGSGPPRCGALGWTLCPLGARPSASCPSWLHGTQAESLTYCPGLGWEGRARGCWAPVRGIHAGVGRWGSGDPQPVTVHVRGLGKRRPCSAWWRVGRACACLVPFAVEVIGVRGKITEETPQPGVCCARGPLPAARSAVGRQGRRSPLPGAPCDVRGQWGGAP